MKLKELEKIIMDDVCIYKEVFEDYEDLYLGKLSAAPEELLEKEIGIIGAKSKGIVDIEIR